MPQSSGRSYVLTSHKGTDKRCWTQTGWRCCNVGSVSSSDHGGQTSHQVQRTVQRDLNLAGRYRRALLSTGNAEGGCWRTVHLGADRLLSPSLLQSASDCFDQLTFTLVVPERHFKSCQNLTDCKLALQKWSSHATTYMRWPAAVPCLGSAVH